MGRSTTSPPETTANTGITAQQFRFVTIGIVALLTLNVVVTIVALVIGLQVKSEVDTIAAEVETIMPYLEMISGAADTASGAVPNGNGP